VLLQHGFFKRGTEKKLVYAKDSGEIALVPNLYGIPPVTLSKELRG
jgi:hypothetical protein